jgi:DNA-binding NtrC family response regulator
VTILPTSILIVDDDLGVRLMLSSVLNSEGYVVETAKNGTEALKACKTSIFDVALIDIQLPDVKGVDLLRKLKKLRPNMINIIITGHPSLESAVKAVNEKADGYVLKPFEVTDLLGQITRVKTENTDLFLKISNDPEFTRDNKYVNNYAQQRRF